MITVGQFRRDLIVLADGLPVASCDTLAGVDECAAAIRVAAPDTKVIQYSFNQSIQWTEDEYGNTWSENSHQFLLPLGG